MLSRLKDIRRMVKRVYLPILIAFVMLLVVFAVAYIPGSQKEPSVNVKAVQPACEKKDGLLDYGAVFLFRMCMQALN